MTQSPNEVLFSLLPQKRAPWKQFALSMGLEGAAIVAIAWVGVLHPEIIVPPKHDFQSIALVETPPPVNHQPQPLRVMKAVTPPTPAPVLAEEAPKIEPLRLAPEVRRQLPKDEPAPVAPKINLAAKTEPVPALTPVVPRKLVKLNGFESTGSSAPQTIAQAPQKTQTGGFGDTNGVPAKANTGKAVNIAQMGSFDMPAGPGNGNGTAGEKGARGVVASAGFGSGTAVGDGSANTNATRGTVRQGGFGDYEPVSASQMHARQEVAAAPKATPAEVISKPNPIYTDEAKKLRIEGEVLLEVVFESGGHIRVLRVVRGLGHGLDEAAARAAEQIHFKPAQRDGQPSDSTAVLHIIFQLA
jgi:TonB family protein